MAHVISPIRATPISSQLMLPAVRRATKPSVDAVTARRSGASAPANAPSAPPPPDFRALFNGTVTVASAPAQNPAPTAESVFGPNPWLANPSGMGPGGNAVLYNPYYFATPATAAKVAQILGGTVVASNEFTGSGGAFAQQQANQMVQLPNGKLVNAGLVAQFYTHNFPQSYIDQLIAEVKNG